MPTCEYTNTFTHACSNHTQSKSQRNICTLSLSLPPSPSLSLLLPFPSLPPPPPCKCLKKKHQPTKEKLNFTPTMSTILPSLYCIAGHHGDAADYTKTGIVNSVCTQSPKTRQQSATVLPHSSDNDDTVIMDQPLPKLRGYSGDIGITQANQQKENPQKQ